jgi:hypothetical protein
MAIPSTFAILFLHADYEEEGFRPSSVNPSHFNTSLNEKFAGNDLEPSFLKQVAIGMTMASMCMMMELYTTRMPFATMRDVEICSWMKLLLFLLSSLLGFPIS